MTPRDSLPRSLWIAIGVSSVIYVLLCLHLPVTLYANDEDDDALFATHAASLYAGHWLGPYDFRTLLKGPGYPLFLALNAALGLPITLSQALLYATACGLLARTLYRLYGSCVLAVAVLIVTEFHPAAFPVEIIRDDVSPAQVLLVFVCMLECLFLASSRRGRLGWAAAAGFCFVWFWLTREDALWIVPAMAVIGLGRLWQCRRRPRPLVASFCVFLVVAASGWLTVAAINEIYYGAFTEVDFNTGAFAQAVQQLQRVRVGVPQAYVPVPKKVRLAIYAVSPTFASLESYLEGPGQSWSVFGCEKMASTCGDVAAGWFAFALRSAVDNAGHYRSAQDSARFYRQLAHEVDDACQAGRLHCASPSVRLMPAVTSAQWRLIPGAFEQAWALLALRGPLTTADASRGDAAQLTFMDNILGRPFRVPAAYESGALELAGWYYAPDHGWIVISCDESGNDMLLPVKRYPSPDVAAAFKDPLAGQVRFLLAVPSATSCGLRRSEGDPTIIGLSAARRGPMVLPGGELFLDSIERHQPVVTGAQAERFLQRLRGIYAALLPGATALAIVACLGGCLLQLRWRRLDDMTIVIGALWVLVIARTGVLVLVTISAFPAMIQRYMLPAYPIMCIAILLSIALPFRKLSE